VDVVLRKFADSHRRGFSDRLILMLAACKSARTFRVLHSARLLNLSKQKVVIAMAIYGFVASVLQSGCCSARATICQVILKSERSRADRGVLLVNPELKLPSYVDWSKEGGGPNFPGQIFHFCSSRSVRAISGFHALVSSGTTPKMINQRRLRAYRYGAMLMEGLSAWSRCWLRRVSRPVIIMRSSSDGKTGRTAAKSEKLREFRDIDNSGFEVQVGEKSPRPYGGAVDARRRHEQNFSADSASSRS